MKINTLRLRVMLGWLAMLLPWIVALFVWQLPESISATWYTNACTPFIIILGSSSILLISYKGYERIDDIILTISGIFGLGICLFPCEYVPGLGIELMTPLSIPHNVSNIIHLCCAISFFLLLAYNSIFLFTKSSGKLTYNKQIRNIIYRICGIGMVASFLLLLLPEFYIQVWLVETIALFFFGISFLTKADIYPWLFCDTKGIDAEEDNA